MSQTKTLKFNSIIKVLGIYTLATALCLGILIWVMRLWDAKLYIPFSYSLGGDSFLSALVIKHVVDNGWTLHNHFLGMPFGLDLHDFPFFDNFHFVLFKIISIWTSRYAYILNISFLLTFPLTVITSLFVFRQFNVSYTSATLGSLLYAFLPYHFWRGESHLFLSSYYLIPLMVMVILWVSLGGRSFQQEITETKDFFSWPRTKVFVSILICILMGSSNSYYAFFACFFLLIAGIIACFRLKALRNLLASIILVAITFATLLINLAPTIVNAFQNGRNAQVAVRIFPESELFGMKIAQLLLPVTGHRFAFLEKLKANYDTAIPNNYSLMASLGIVGAIGFLFLIGCLLACVKKSTKGELIHRLSTLNIFGVLLATIGGFGSLFAFFISPQIRAYDRMSIYLGFFSLFAVVLLLDTLKEKISNSKRGQYFYFLASVGILTVGILDQTGLKFPFVPPYTQNRVAHLNDLNFVRKIEKSLPEGSMIFQLPYVSFPEVVQVNRMTDYDHFRGYFHSKHLRWSYGAMRGREGDLWQNHVSSLSVEEMVPLLIVSGFKGIYIDRYGYPDNAAELEGKLIKILGQSPLVSKDKRLIFFKTTNKKHEVTKQLET